MVYSNNFYTFIKNNKKKMNNYKSCFYLYKQNKPEKKIIDIDIDNLDLDDWDYYEQNDDNSLNILYNVFVSTKNF